MFRGLAAACLIAFCVPAAGDGCFVPRKSPSPRDIYEPTQKALIVFQQGRQDLILQVKYSGAAEDFAWIVPTPSHPTVNLADSDIFAALSLATNPKGASGGGGGGLGGGALGGLGRAVHVFEQKTVGVYDVTVLAASDSSALIGWLNGNGYAVSARLLGVVEEYIRRGFVFTAMRIDPAKAAESGPDKRPAVPQDGILQPIRLTFRAAQPIYPLKISSLNGGKSDLLIYLMTPSPVSTAGLREEYSSQKRAPVLNGITRNQPLITGDLWLTRLSARMPAASMTRDLEFSFRHPGALRPLRR